MEENKEQSEKCRDLAKSYMKAGNYPKAIKFFEKSLRLYPLTGVQSMIDRCKREMSAPPASSSSSPSSASPSGSGARRRSAAAQQATENRQRQESGTADVRDYTPAQASVADSVRRASKSPRDAHYKVLGVERGAGDAEIKKAYRRLSLKVHPDKNPAPGADEAFKAVGLAYATLSDDRKRQIYDATGDVDPDNSGGSTAAHNPFAGMRRQGGGRHGEVDPQDIFNMFFGGGVPGGMGGMGGPGFRVYSTGFGGMPRQQRGGGGQRRQQQQQQQQGAGFLQLLPLLFFLLLSFTSLPDDASTASSNQYFSLTHKPPFVHPMETKHRGVVRDIPYFVTDKYMRSTVRDPYKSAQVERMVEKSYEQYLQAECRAQRKHQRQLRQRAAGYRGDPRKGEQMANEADEFKLTRCDEHRDLFGATQGRR